MSAADPAWDAVVVGAGPAGLTAATYLARFRRAVLVLHHGPSRAAWIPESHNTPGFPSGIGGPVLLERLRAQAASFGAELRDGRVEQLTAEAGGFRMEGAFGVIRSRSVLLATGVSDRMPPIAGIAAAIRRGLVRLCPICDGFEATGRRLAVLGDSDFANREADFLSTYSADVTVLRLDRSGPASAPGAQHMTLDDLVLEEAEAVLRSDGRERRFDHLYLALGCQPRSDLAIAAGAGQDELGKLLVDAHQMTSVPGLYAAGDVVRGLNQIAVGAGEAAIAATAMHNLLRDPA
ncbi:MAG: NAD(P)/FAD-dependent oxidoreductase [Pseudomonadota bacterium]